MVSAGNNDQPDTDPSNDLSKTLSTGTKLLIGHSIGLIVVVLLLIGMAAYLKAMNRRRALLRERDDGQQTSSVGGSTPVSLLENWTLRRSGVHTHAVLY